MNRARSFVCIRAGLLCLALLLPLPGAAYEQTDLQGIWESNCLASGPGAPWWERARITVAADGSFTGFNSYSDGGGGTLEGLLILSPEGIVTAPGSNTIRLVLDADKTVIVGTDTWSYGSPGTTELRVVLKMAETYGLSDLSGDWELNAIASGPGAPWWMRGRLTVAADGSFSGTLMDNQGEPHPQASTFNISPDGVVTIAASSTARGVMDAGKSALVLTSTWAYGSPGTTDLGVGVKMAETYSQADLVGRWEVNGLATGPGAPWWSRGQLTVEDDGSFTGLTVESDGGGGPTSGTFSISPDGVVTLAGSDSFRGVLDVGKTVMVWTSIWSDASPGTTELDVATKMSDGPNGIAEAIPTAFSLRQNYPNPFNPRTNVSFTVDRPQHVTISVFDMTGRRVTFLADQQYGAGSHTVEWNGQDASGRAVSSGTYLVRMEAADKIESQKISLVR